MHHFLGINVCGQMLLAVTLVVVLLLASLTSTALGDPSWFWTAPHAFQTQMIVEADEGYQALVPRLYVYGNIIAFDFWHAKYISDAVTEDTTVRWYVSYDGGGSWMFSPNTPMPFSQTFYSTNPSFELNDGSWLAAESWGYEHYDDTPANRASLSAQGYLLFTPELGNAEGIVSILHRARMMRSYNQGGTWDVEQIPFSFDWAFLGTWGPGMVLDDGMTFVWPVCGHKDLAQEPWYESSYLCRTTDGGDTWSVHTIAAGVQDENNGFDFNETSITQAPNGDLIALIRTTEQYFGGPDKLGQRHLWTSISTDGGVTWAEPWDSGLLGSHPCLVTTKDGLIVAIHVRRGTELGGGDFDETGIFAGVSRDYGRTWSHGETVQLYSNGTNKVDGSGWAVALLDGSVYTVQTSGPADNQIWGSRVIFEPGLNIPLTCNEAMEQGYSKDGDVNGDCYVDLLDLTIMSSEWLRCAGPTGNVCE